MPGSRGASSSPRAPWRNTSTVSSRSSGSRKRTTTTAACSRSSRSSNSASQDLAEPPRRDVRLREEPDGGAGGDQLREVRLRIRRDQHHGREFLAVLSSEHARKVEAALLAEGDVDQRDVGLELARQLNGLRARRRHAHDRDPLVLEQRARGGEEARVVVDYQRTECHRPDGSGSHPSSRCTLQPAGRSRLALAAKTAGLPGAIVVPMRVLVVEDEIRLASLLRKGLRQEGLLADVAIKGEDALWMAASSGYDAIVLDIVLPGIDGIEVCRRLRAERVGTPILMLTARDAVHDRIAGLDAGADDYLVKPFDFGELLARLRALGRRGAAEKGTVLRVGDLELDPTTRRVRRAGQEVALTAKEFQVLEVFMRHPDHVLTRYQLLEGAWDAGYEHHSNIIDVYIRCLRDKLDRPFGVQSIETVRGAGYRMRAA